MNAAASQILVEIEELLQSKNYSKALNQLKEIDSSSFSREERGDYYLLLTEAGLQVGDYSVNFADEAIEVFRRSADSDKFARAKLLKGWSLIASGHYLEAKQALLEAYANYLRDENLAGAARALNRLTFVSQLTGNIHAAVENLESCINICDKLGDSINKAKAAHNLAYLYFMSGNLSDSLSTYDAYPVSEQEHGEKPVMNFFYMSAIPHAFKGDIATAKKTIAKATPYFEKYPREKAIYYENLGLILILDGDYAGAEKALKEGLRISLEIAPESALVSQIKRLFGDLYIAVSGTRLDSRLHGNDIEPQNDKELPIDKGASFLRRQETSDASFLRRQETSDVSFLRRQESSIALAEQYASEALQVAEKINERVEIAACYRILAQVEQQRGGPTTSGGAPSVVNRPHPCPSPSVRRGVPAGGVRILCQRRGRSVPDLPYRTDKAREWYRKAIDLFNLIGSRYELAVTRFLAATSGLYSNGERMAMLYLAREYFESEEVNHYVEKIDAALKAAPTVHRPIRKPSPSCPTIIAVNPQMKKLIALAEHVAESEMTVLLTGATGAGKDLLARYIHYQSGRIGEFVAVNAAAIPDTMIEAELFGYKKGAFTGSTDRTGLLEQAHDGTFYLNEITDATPVFQAKLLVVLESREIRRLGENTTRKVNFRLIAASNHDLHQRMRDNLFRLDLYHRLNEICIHLPSLDERKDDIPALVQHFLTFAGFDLTNGHERQIERLGRILSHRIWPGNVRELEHEVKRLWTHAKGDVSRMIELTLDSSSKSKPELLLQLLEMYNWNRRRVARIMGVSEGTIRIWIKKFGLTRQ
jgi:DNA-binding NtrC family response regulator